MGLRLKNALVISGIFLAVIAATYLLFSVSLLHEFKELERARTAKNLERVWQALRAVESDLGNRALDWGHWDESLAFVEGSNPEYVESNLNYEALLPFELKHVLILTRGRDLLFGSTVSPDSQGLEPIANATSRHIVNNPIVSDFIAHPTEQSLTGLLMVDGAPTFIAISSITDSKAQRLPSGFIIFTRELSQNLQKRLADQTQLPLLFYSRRDSDPVVTTAPQSSSIAIKEDSDYITGAAALRDLSGQHVATAEFSQPRDILQQGEATRDSLIVVIALFLIFANGVVLLFVDRTVLHPLARFARRITTISKTNDLTLKVTVDRHDEIGRLAEVFNSLIDSLRYSYQRLHEARNAAQDANESKSKFIAAVSHELRTPIHSITGMLRLLRSQEISEMRRSYIDMANDAAFGLLDTINDILDFSKCEAGAMRLESREFDLVATMQRAARNVSPGKSAAAGPVELILDIDPHLPTALVGDAHRLSQVITNLLGNACKFTHEGFVRLRVHEDPGNDTDTHLITFTVDDSGIGISDDHIESIFQPYHQGAESTPRLYQGSGLGLSIVRQIVEQMGGTISVSSEIHRGSRFTMRIPLRGTYGSCELKQANIRTALVIPRTSATQALAESFMHHTRFLDLFDPERTADRIRLLSSMYDYDQIILWSPPQRALPELTAIVQESQRCSIHVSAVLNPDDTSLRQSLMEIGIENFPLKTSGIGAILATSSTNSMPRFATSPLIDSLPQSSHPLRVLIADDAPTNCIILQSLLEEAGHSVEVVTNGLDLLNRLRPMAVGDDSMCAFDLVLTDMQMPIMDGNTAIRKLRLLEESSGKNRRLPVVAVTAHALPEEQATMRRAGVDEIVTKPISPADLQRVLATCTDKALSPTTSGEASSSVERALKKMVRECWGSADGQDEAIDISDVFDRSGNSLRRTRMILRAFLSAYGNPRDEIVAYLSSGDTSKLSRAIHTLKGLLLDVGARSIAVRAAQLEEHTKKSPGDNDFHGDATYLIVATGRLAERIEKLLLTLPEAR